MQRFPARPTLLLACALALPGCLTAPRQDPAGEPARALAYALGKSSTEQLDCDRADCVDWHVYDVPEPGYTVVSLEVVSSAKPVPELEVAITGASPDDVLATATTRDGRLRQRWILTPTPHYFRIEQVESGPNAPALTYTLRTTWEPRRARPAPPPPPPPEPSPPPPTPSPPPEPAEPPAPSAREREREIETLLIGIEGEDALLGQGSRDGLRVGLRGRIVENGRTLTGFEVVEVFPEGSRARLDELPEPLPGPGAKALVELPPGR